MILDRKQHIEYHPNGQVWISGEIGIVADAWKHLYNTLSEFKGHEELPVCRVGKWTKQYNNGQLAWTLEYDECGYETGKNHDRFREDGTIIS